MKYTTSALNRMLQVSFEAPEYTADVDATWHSSATGSYFAFLEWNNLPVFTRHRPLNCMV